MMRSEITVESKMRKMRKKREEVIMIFFTIDVEASGFKKARVYPWGILQFRGGEACLAGVLPGWA